MKYIVYDISKDSPSLAERDIIWSVLLFGDKVEITSKMALPFIIYGDFPQYDFEQKFYAYRLFRFMIEQAIPWNDFEFHIKHVAQQRKKKNKTGLEIKDLAGREIWLRKNENWFMTSLRDNLAKWSLDEIVPLTLRYDERKEPDVTMTIPVEALDSDLESEVKEHFIKIITNALSKPDNLFVFDEKIKPFIILHPLNEYNGKTPVGNEKVIVYAEKILNVPLCYTLKADEIKMARNELTQQFREFHEGIHKISKDEENFKKELKKLHDLLPDLQYKLGINAFVSKAKNQKLDMETVELHLAFTSNRNILTILHNRGMLNEEQLLQASEIVSKASDLNQMHAFMYITHSK